MATGQDLVDLARMHIGETYVLGAFVPKDNPKWKGPWDCAEFGSWLVYQVTSRLYGCQNNAGQPWSADAYTGYWNRDVQSLGTLVSPEEAAGTGGAFLLRVPPGTPGTQGHLALSDGLGGTIEAMGTAYGVVKASAIGRRWDHGVLVPWITYMASAPVSLAPPRVLSYGDHGPDVRAVQSALKKHGFNPGVIDSIFGPHTLAAVTGFQRARGLVVDGEVGPQTKRALGL